MGSFSAGTNWLRLRSLLPTGQGQIYPLPLAGFVLRRILWTGLGAGGGGCKGYWLWLGEGDGSLGLGVIRLSLRGTDDEFRSGVPGYHCLYLPLGLLLKLQRHQVSPRPEITR